MDILENPFLILGATTRDNRHRIMELSDEKSLLSDEKAISSASSTLTNPRKRLSAEIAWLPGLGPKRTTEAILQIEKKTDEILDQDNLPALARANLLAAGLKRHVGGADSEKLSEWINKLAEVFDEIDQEVVLGLINEEREVSGFPTVTDQHALEAEIDGLRQYFRSVIRDSFNLLSSNDLVEILTEVVESATDMGDFPAPILIDDIVDTYEVEAQDFLDKEEENIDELLKRIRGNADEGVSESALTLLIDELISVVENWDTVAQPIQVSTKSRGLGHDASTRVASKVRGLGVHLFNEHGNLELSKKISTMLQGVFAEVVDVADQAEEDIFTLDDLAEQRDQAEERSEEEDAEWAREISFEVEIGAVFKDKFAISPSGVQWKGVTTPLEEITCVRWGGTSHSVNGIPTGTNYKVVFGTKTNITTIDIRKGRTYEAIIGRLWKAACVKILLDTVNSLKAGNTIQCGNMSLTDHGANIRRRKMFGSGDVESCKWSELHLWSAEGSFLVGKKGDKKLVASMSYQDDDNVHILEFILRHKFKKPGPTLSGSFG
jgi:hypothetical protein